MMSYRSSVDGTDRESKAQDQIKPQIKNRWAKINQISKDYDKYTLSKTYANPVPQQ